MRDAGAREVPGYIVHWHHFAIPAAGDAVRIYLDHAATTPLLPGARAAMEEGFRLWANPSSPHAEGRIARARLEDARARVKSALGWDGEVIFTSGASEAIALALSRSRKRLAATSAVEHDAVLRLASDAARLGVDGEGVVDLPDGVCGLVAIQHVNNETGVIQPLDRLGQRVRDGGGWLLADCAQSAAKLALPDAEMVAISAHKFGGPIGIGALLVRDYAMLEATGGQERGYRAGTENLPAVLGMLAALEEGRGWLGTAPRLRARLEKAIEDAGGEVVARAADRLATIGAYRMPAKAAAAQLIRFDAMGFAISAGSACSSGSLKPSPVLEAMGRQGAAETIRVSIGRETTESGIDRFVEAWREVARA